jgi:hypothetical protein
MEKRSFVYLLLFFSIVLFANSVFSLQQQSYILDLQDVKFNFSAYELNDSSTSKELVFSANESLIVWVSLPKNSTILSTLIKIEGLSKPLQTTTQQQVIDLDVGNIIPAKEWDEIIVGTAGASQNLKLLNASGHQLWNYSISSEVPAVSIGNLSQDEGLEIVAASNEPKIYVLNSSGNVLVVKTMANIIYDLEVNDIAPSPYDEIAVASSDNRLYLLDYDLSEIWNFSASSPFKGVGVGELSSSAGKEIAASSGSVVYLLNSSGQLINSKDVGILINDVDVADVDGVGYDEIAVATNNGTLYMLDNSLNILWSFSASDIIDTVKIGEVTSEYTGKETVIGSYDDYVYVVNKDGSLVWKYKTENDVKGVGIGNLTADPGNEVVAGTQIPATYTLYVLNFEYFPTNPYLDIGNDSSIEWSYSGKFREEAEIANNTAFQQFLNDCSPDERGRCLVPLKFHSDFPGILKIKSINITYEYNITNILKVDTVAAWSRTNEVRANESVGSQIKNISYISNPANDIIIKYISVDDAATVCDFNGTRYSVIAINGKKYCNISSKPRLLASYGNASYDWLWDNSMTSSIAVYYNETQGISQYGFWKKNLTVWNNTPAIFTNVIINTTLDENYITGNSRLKVDWFDNGTFFDITPANAQTNCISMPTYTAVQLGNDTFYVCKQDTNNDGRIDFFIWKQPHTNKSYTIYEVSGSANNPPQVSQVSITPSQDFWGKNFTITANISDVEGNNVSVRVCFNLTHTFNLSQVNFSSLEWQCLQEKNTTNDTSLGEIMTFEIESNKTWTGNNLLVFQLRDFDESIEYHEWFFSNIYFGPNVTKHYTEAILVSGNNSNVNRSQTVLLSIIVNDTVNNSSVGNAKCRFWVSINGTHWDEGKDVFSNSSGYCDYQFTPNSSYMPGMRWWKAGIYEDEYYNNSMTQNFTISIYGKININLTEDARGNITRNRLKQIKARIFDEYGKTINESGYQCSFKLNETTIGSNTTSSSGICTIAFLPDCYYDLGEYILNVTLSGEVNPYYIYNKSSDTASIYLKDSLNATILSPSNELYHKNDEMNLSFSLLDSCGIPDKPYSSLWAFNCTTQGYPPYYNTSSEQNTTWQVQCNPGILVLTLKVYGNLYETEIKSKNIDIYGWSQVKLLQPLNGTYNRTETDRKIDIVCEVFDANASSIKLDPYTVDIFYRYEGSEPVKLASKNTVYPTGRVNYTWNISSNETVPEGWYKIACNISDQVLDAYRKYNASVKEDYADILIIEKDTMPPRVNSILVNSTMLNGNTTLYANVTDWYGVSAVWIEMLYPNKTRNTFYLENQSADLRQTIWSINFSSLNLLGDYDIVLYANDTSNYTTINQTWFEVYLPIQLYAETSYPKMYEFYRPGTSLLIHNFTYGTGWHNLTLHQRNYDLKAKIEDEIAQKHEIIFSDLNTTLTSENQFGQISNITNPLNISVIPLSLLNPPVPWRHEVAGVYISTNYAFSNVTVSFDYSKKLSEIDYAPALVIYKCANWTSQCNSGWVSVNTTVNTTSYRAFTVQNATSAYYLFEAEICGNGICGIGESCVNCVADCGECGSGSTGPTPSGVSGGGGGGGYRAYCGNGICDSDENAFTCPQDCTSGFSVKTNLTTDYVMSGAKKGYAIWISNLMSQPIQASILINGPASNLLSLTENLVIIDALKEKEIKLELIVPKNIEPGAYTGEIIVSANNRKERLPITIFVTKEAHEVQLAVKVITKNLKPNETLAFEVSIFSLTQKKEFPANIRYTIKAFKDDKIVYSEEEYLLIKTPYQSLKYVRLPENITAGKYYIIVNATYENEMLSSVDSFDVYTSFITAKAIRYAFIGMAAFLALTASIIAFKRYQAWRKARLRYIFPVDFNLLPKGDLSIGKIAETNVKATFDSNELTTHILVAGATGAGKSVTASIFAEEVLSKKIPVVVFDPTAQWTGFVKPCKDENVLKYYKKHGLSVDDAKSYPGNIYEMTDPKAKIDFKKYMNPGEITVFVLNKLKPGEYDEAVTNIIDSIFSQSWEESTTTKLVIVFDEVHRLLEKYGGKGGYVALERACREFRKWGIGLIMVSQVLSDFKEAIKGNVLTEIQMHTKSLSDLQRIEKKYGLEYARRVAKEEVGIGMIQNPKYNKGLPWFVSFRPPLHMPHKITEQEMQMYKEYNSRIEKLEQEIERLEKEGKDVFDLKIELRLAKDKLKKGMFRVAEIYIESLNKKLGLSK